MLREQRFALSNSEPSSKIVSGLLGTILSLLQNILDILVHDVAMLWTQACSSERSNEGSISSVHKPFPRMAIPILAEYE